MRSRHSPDRAELSPSLGKKCDQHSSAAFLLACLVLAVTASCTPPSVVNRLAFHPERVPETFHPPSGMAVDEIYLASADSTRLHALYFPSDTRRVVLYLHGNGGHAFHRLNDAAALAETGTSVLLLGYRGYGKSEGAPSEQGMYADGRAALEYLQQVAGFSREHTFVLGRSIGSAIAVHIVQDEPIAGLILIAPLSNGRDMANHLGFGWLSWLFGHPFDSTTKISRVEAPTLFIHGDQDRVVPLELGRRLFETSPAERKTFRAVSGAGHNDLISIAGPELWSWIREFMDAVADRSHSSATADEA